MSLNFFPARIPIGRAVLPDGTEVPVLSTPEYWRAMAAMFDRVGGANGMGIGDLEILTSFAQEPASELAGAMADVEISAAFAQAPAPARRDEFDAEPSMVARVAELEKRLAETDLRLSVASSQLTMAAELMKRVEDIALGHHIAAVPMEFVELTKTVMALEIQAAFAPQATDWEHPGPVGAKTANTGSFTNAAYTGTLTGGTGVVNIGSGQLYKDDGGNIGINTATPNTYTNYKTLTLVGGSSGFEIDFMLGSTLLGYMEMTTSLIKIDVEGSARYLQFVLNGSERGRFAASTGNLLLGTTTDGMASNGSLAVAKDFSHRGSNLGLFNTTPTTKQTVTGSRAGNAALASLLTGLAAYGLVIDSSTA